MESQPELRDNNLRDNPVHSNYMVIQSGYCAPPGLEQVTHRDRRQREMTTWDFLRCADTIRQRLPHILAPYPSAPMYMLCDGPAVHDDDEDENNATEELDENEQVDEMITDFLTAFGPTKRDEVVKETESTLGIEMSGSLKNMIESRVQVLRERRVILDDKLGRLFLSPEAKKRLAVDTGWRPFAAQHS